MKNSYGVKEIQEAMRGEEIQEAMRLEEFTKNSGLPKLLSWSHELRSDQNFLDHSSNIYFLNLQNPLHFVKFHTFRTEYAIVHPDRQHLTPYITNVKIKLRTVATLLVT